LITLAYLDTSAFLKLFLEEGNSAEVAAAAQKPEELWALRLVLTESRITLERARKEGRLTAVEFTAISDSVNDFWDTEIQVLELNETAYLAAERIAARQPGLRTLDALHVGAARMLKKDLPQVRVELLACDERLLLAAAAAGLATPIPPRTAAMPAARLRGRKRP
jgi:predicted nucleic acid-binding protein